MALIKIRPNFDNDHHAGRKLVMLFACMAVCLFASIANANAETRTLKLYYLHTGEKTKVTYYKNGKYLASGLKKANWALRDWRRNEPTKMDPKLLDLVYEVYRKTGAKSWIHVISGYRSPKTNNALRKRGGGQAKNSQHTHGRALDFFLPGVKISKLRKVGLKMGIGGVGYYPRSGSPFVHLDTGNVRHWPRMTRSQLARVFPKGKTMHVPSDGKPLARYKTAVAEYKRKKNSGKIVTTPDKKELNFFQRLAARTKDDEDEGRQNNAAVPRAVKTTVRAPAPKPAPETKPAETIIAALPKNVPVPISAPRGGSINSGSEIVVAALPQEEPKPTETPIEEKTPEVLEPVVDEAVAENPQSDFTIPIPVKRPEFEAAILMATNEQEEIQSEIAIAETTPKVEEAETQIATLTPTEIQDIRRAAEPTPVSNEIPRPSNSVGVAPNGLPLAETFPIDETANASQTKPEPIEEPAILPTVTPEPAPVTETAKLEPTVEALPLPSERPEPRESVEAPVIVPEPLPNPKNKDPEFALAIVDEKPSQVEQNALAAISATSPIGETGSNNEPEIIKTVEQLEAERNNPQLALNIPIPTPSPRQPETIAPIVVASLEPEKAPAIEPIVNEVNETVDNQIHPKTTEQSEPTIVAKLEQAPVTPEIEPEILQDDEIELEQIPSLKKRTVSLDQYSAPEENSSSIGQYALLPNISIRDLDAIQPPAYGRNMIRNSPKTVFIEGFRTNILPGTQLGFSGNAIVFTKFETISNSL